MNTAISLPASVLNGAAAPDRSARFVPFRTADAVELLQREGFELIKAEGVKAGRSKGSAISLYGKHTVQMGLPTVLEEGRPMVLLTNANDGSAAVTIRTGLFRFVCSNGLVIGKSLYHLRQRHAGLMAEELIRRCMDVSASVIKMQERIERWSAIELTGPQRTDFARLAAQLRFGDADTFEPRLLLEAKREEDDRGDLWRTFNVVQENAVHGGFSGETWGGRRVRARTLAGMDSYTAFNEKLWTLAEEFAAAV